jgi:hypothetical protein
MWKKVTAAVTAAVVLSIASAAIAAPKKPCYQQYDSSGAPVAPYCK